MDAKLFGEFVAKCRRKKGLTQAQLAEKLNVTDKAVSRWERGVGFPDISTIESLASSLELSVLEIMKSEENATKTVTENITEKTFGITGVMLWPYKIYFTYSTIDKLPDDMKKHVKGGGDLYLVKVVDDDNVIISVSKRTDDLHTVINRYDVITKLGKARADVIATYPEEMKKHIENSGRLYMLGYPKDTDEEVTISTSKDGSGYSMTVKYFPWIHDAETDFAKIGALMKKYIFIIKRSRCNDKRISASYGLRNYLIYCTTIKELDDLTCIYRDKVSDLITGYEPTAILMFVCKLCERYPNKQTIYDTYFEHRDRIYGEIGNIIAEMVNVVRNEPDSEYFDDAVKTLREYLDECLRKPGMNNMTLIFKNKICDNVIGYDLDAVEAFANFLIDEYSFIYK